MHRRIAALALFGAIGFAAHAQAKGREAALVVTGARPGAIVSVDGIRIGRVDAAGSRRITSFGPGRRTVMVRQVGFRDDTRVIALVSGRTATVRPAKVAIADKAELAFQRADDLAFSGKHADAIPLYSEALAQRNGRFPAAGIGLARSLMALKQLDEATDAIAAVITATPGNAEAQTVSGNILRDRGLYEEAADAYRKAIRLGGGRMPEAHTGLAITLEEQGDLTGAAAEFKTAIAQNGDAEPLLYQLRGGVLERLARSKEALADYRRFLQLAPQHPLAAAVRSVVERLAAETGTAQPDDSDVNPYAPKP